MQLGAKPLPKQAVPTNYIGVWQRHLLETASIKDDSSLVFWMQSQHLHIDIRIPAACTGFKAASTLLDYSDAELMMLASQQGFAGLTQVRASTPQSSDVCQWLREIDYQPPTQSRDIGKMVFTDADTVIETGIDDTYLEVWRRLNNSQNPCFARMTTGINRLGIKIPAYLIQAGKYVAYARPRNIQLPNALSLLDAIKTHKPDRTRLIDWLDMEISFGEMIDENYWIINHSTLPFKQNLVIELPIK
jgi:hypothetical protein